MLGGLVALAPHLTPLICPRDILEAPEQGVLQESGVGAASISADLGYLQHQ